MYNIILEFKFVSFYHSILCSPQIRLVLHGTTIHSFVADYRLRRLVNNVAIQIYAHVYIRMQITVSYLKFHGISWRFDAVKFSNTIQLSPK